jgi:hypothetical protein
MPKYSVTLQETCSLQHDAHFRDYLLQPDEFGNVPTGEKDPEDINAGGDGKVFSGWSPPVAWQA